MRPATSAELVAVAARDRRMDWEVWVANADGSLVEWTSWVESWSVDEDLERFVLTADVQFMREQDDTSLAVLMNDPPLISPGRDIEIWESVVQQGETPGPNDRRLVFRGTIDDAEWGGDDSVLSVPCMGWGRQLLKKFIKSPTEYGSAAGVAMQTVIQSILDAAFGAGEITLVVEDDPSYGIVTYTQRRESTRDASQALVDLNGYLCRPRWNEAAQDWRLTLYEPARDKTTPDHTFGPSDYISIDSLAISTTDIRNEIEILWAEGADSVVVQDSGSISEYGEEYMFIDASADPQIDTEAKALALALAILGDLSQPRATQVVTGKFFPFTELGDLYRWSANDLYATAQDMAVTGYSHRGDRGGAIKTTMRVRGQPSGGATRWFRRKQRSDREKEIRDVAGTEVEALSLEDLVLLLTNPALSGGYTDEGTAETSLGEWISTTPMPEGLDELFPEVTPAQRTAGITQYRAVALANLNDDTVPKPYEGVRLYLSDLGEGGIHWSIALDPSGIVPLEDTEIQALVTSDEETPPDVSPYLSFVQPDSFTDPDVIEVGTIGTDDPNDPKEAVVVWIERVVDPDATAQITSTTLVFQDSVPPEEMSS